MRLRILLVPAAALTLLLTAQPPQPEINARHTAILKASGLRFRDANHNGTLDTYEDWRRTPKERAQDLLKRMTLAEKAGAMMHGTAAAVDSPIGASSKGYDLALASRLIAGRHVTSLITRLSMRPRDLAAQNNLLQEAAEKTRLGIPLTISTDPRHHFQYVTGITSEGNGFSQWPETLGFAALNDETLMRQFASIARQEYRAVGITMALSPQADLATEPRWPRVTGTFGEDPEVAFRMTRAYVAGFQNGDAGLRPGGVAAIVKHWVGYGAAKDGWDSHSYYGRYAQTSARALAAHIRPFEGAFAVKVAGVMPTYSILENLTVDGKAVEQVGGGFNRWLVTDLLRGKHGFGGLVLSDWAITNDCNDACRNGAPAGQPPSPRDISMAWGVEHLTAAQRFAKGVNAGIDQFGGTEDSSSLMNAAERGEVAPARIDAAVERILEMKFQLGLFENPYADEAAADANTGRADWTSAGRQAQARAMVLLENKDAVLPLRKGRRVALRGIATGAAREAGLIPVDRMEDADVALLRTATPHQLLHPQFFFGLRHHEGDLDFKPGDADWAWMKAAKGKPVVMAIYLDRPAILTEIGKDAAAILANFGASDAALMDALTGRVEPRGRLPFELPRSMDAVRRQRSDTPHDSERPLYPLAAGHGYR